MLFKLIKVHLLARKLCKLSWYSMCSLGLMKTCKLWKSSCSVLDSILNFIYIFLFSQFSLAHSEVTAISYFSVKILWSLITFAWLWVGGGHSPRSEPLRYTLDTKLGQSPNSAWKWGERIVPGNEVSLEYFFSSTQPTSNASAFSNDQETGVILRGYKRMQMNIFLKKTSDLNALSKVSEGLFPVFWVEEVSY